MKLAEFLEAYRRDDRAFVHLSSLDQHEMFAELLAQHDVWKARALRAEEWNRQQAKEK